MPAMEAATVGRMGASAGASCPICRKSAGPRPENPVFPFCSPQCKLLDLGRWLDGSYRVPGPPVSSTNDDEALESRGRANGLGGNIQEEDE
ncbi:DNA gyrase inhibitor YacG [Sorangium sp. So ce834]|uniref:DNA gyrase inhibitor YacG n=1 Tax=Sorangium sp. So ce834 TaxID=3133321 RepID=UPI003F6019CA